MCKTGPSSEGPQSVRLRAWLKWIACLATLALVMGGASNAAAQYTVAPGGSVSVSPCRAPTAVQIPRLILTGRTQHGRWRHRLL